MESSLVIPKKRFSAEQIVTLRWFSGSTEILTYLLGELLGAKLSALYQRKKGRDLLDVAVALENVEADPPRTIAAFSKYMDHGGHCVTRAQFKIFPAS